MPGPRSGDRPEGLLEIARIVKVHGIRGEVVVDPVTNRPERFQPGVVHHLDDARLVVERARRHQGRWIVSYEGLSDRSEAERLRGRVLWAEPIEVTGEPELWVHELIGSEVVDAGGTSRGRVVSVEANPAHDILVLDSGALVPVVFVDEVSGDRVRVVVPDGLFDDDLVAANRAAVERRPASRKRGGRRRGRDGSER